MNFDLTQDQQVLISTAAAFVKRESPPGRLRRLREDALGYSPQLWRRMAELGWLGLPFSEDDGGFGGSFVDVALLLEQLGTTLVPEPYVPAVILGGMAVQRAGTAAQRARHLPPLIAGEELLALAYAGRDGRFDVTRLATTATRDGAGYRLDGEKIFVLAGPAAHTLLVSARTGGSSAAGERAGVSLFMISRDAPGLTVEPVRTMDGQRAATVRLAGVAVGAEQLLGAEGEAAPLLEWLMDLGAAAACAEGLGIARAVLDMTCEYLRTREQFGVKIGSFQALQHRAVDMFVETELLRSMAILASIKADDPSAGERMAAVSAAKVQLSQGGRLVTQAAIQLHGGIGITDEHDVGLYFKRMQVLSTLFGDEEHHLRRYAALPSFLAGVGEQRAA